MTTTTAPHTTRVGFIGLGIMGAPMAANLATTGYHLVVHNRSPAAAERLAAHDTITVADSPAAVTRQSDIIITMLPDGPDVNAVLSGDHGILAAISTGQMVIDMSTIAPAMSIDFGRRLRERGASFLDAPVSGGDKGAKDGTLSIMVGGDAADFERARPLFEIMGKTIVHVGEQGAGEIAKACNQIAVAVNIAGLSEALMLGSSAGVDPARIIEVLSGGLAGSRVIDTKSAGMLTHRFDPGFRVELHRKDLGIVNRTATENGVPLPVAALVTQLFDALAANGGDKLDHSALLTVYERLSGHEMAQRQRDAH